MDREFTAKAYQAQCIAAVALGVDCSVHPQGLMNLGATNSCAITTSHRLTLAARLEMEQFLSSTRSPY